MPNDKLGKAITIRLPEWAESQFNKDAESEERPLAEVLRRWIVKRLQPPKK